MRPDGLGLLVDNMAKMICFNKNVLGFSHTGKRHVID